MKIAGIQKLSLIDFPGHISAVIFTYGCNFKCGYCQNPDLVKQDPGFVSQEEEVFNYLALRKNVIEGVVISGGEPTIYKDLPELIKRIKDQGFKVKLDTNGADPEGLKEILDSNLLDYVAMDIKTSFGRYDEVTCIKGAVKLAQKSIKHIMSSKVPYEFRTTCVPGVIDEEDVKAIGVSVKGAKKYCLQQFRPEVTLDERFEKLKPFGKETLEKFKTILEKSVQEVELRGV